MSRPVAGHARGRRAAPMDAQVFTEHFALEDTHWWFRSKRALVLSLLRRHGALGGPGSTWAAAPGGMLAALAAAGHLGRRGRRAARARPLAEARARAARRSVAEALPFREGTFAACLCLDLLYHRNVVSEAGALGECHRVLRPGGLLVVTDSAFAWLRSAHDEAVHGARRYTRRELVDARPGRGLHAAPRLLRLLPRLPRGGRRPARAAGRPPAAPTSSRSPARSTRRSWPSRRSSGRSSASGPLPFGSSVVWWRGRRRRDRLGGPADVQRARGHRRRGPRDPRRGRRRRGAGRRRRLARTGPGRRWRPPSPATGGRASSAGSAAGGCPRPSPRASRAREATWWSGSTPTAPCRPRSSRGWSPRRPTPTSPSRPATRRAAATPATPPPASSPPARSTPSARCGSGGPVRDWTSGFVAARRTALARVPIRTHHVYGDYCIDFLHRACRAGLRVVEVPYANVERRAGETKTSPTCAGSPPSACATPEPSGSSAGRAAPRRIGRDRRDPAARRRHGRARDIVPGPEPALEVRIPRIPVAEEALTRRIIPVSDPRLDGNELRYLTQCIQSNWISSAGRFVREFEEAFARWSAAGTASRARTARRRSTSPWRPSGSGPATRSSSPPSP